MNLNQILCQKKTVIKRYYQENWQKMDESIAINVVLHLVSVLWLYIRIFLFLGNKLWSESLSSIQFLKPFRKKNLHVSVCVCMCSGGRRERIRKINKCSKILKKGESKKKKKRVNLDKGNAVDLWTTQRLFCCAVENLHVCFDSPKT